MWPFRAIQHPGIFMSLLGARSTTLGSNLPLVKCCIVANLLKTLFCWLEWKLTYWSASRMTGYPITALHHLSILKGKCFTTGSLFTVWGWYKALCSIWLSLSATLLQTTSRESTPTSETGGKGDESKSQTGGRIQTAVARWKQIIQLKPWPILTVCVVPVSTLSMGEDSKQSFQHQRKRAGQQGSEGGGQGSAWGSQGPLGGWDDCPHGLAEVARPQDDGGDIQLQFDTTAIDLGVATTQSRQGCLCAKCFDVSTTVA